MQSIQNETMNQNIHNAIKRGSFKLFLMRKGFFLAPHNKSDKVCRFFFSVSKNLRKKCVIATKNRHKMHIAELIVFAFSDNLSAENSNCLRDLDPRVSSF